jgi:hypothetical protein
MIDAKVIEDSIGPNGKRIVTFVLTYPRFIHSEVMTHRSLSRNASSSRAIPVKKQIVNVLKHMAIPIHVGANKKGMQASKEVSVIKKRIALIAWKILGYIACLFAFLLDKLGVHKQVANRVIEPWSHISVVVTATELNNFFSLRYHKDAQPEFYELAKKMYDVISKSIPNRLKPGDWHLPFVTADDLLEAERTSFLERGDNSGVLFMLLKISAARCARVSYLNHDNKFPTVKEDIDLYERLAYHKPMHASPLEHQACATLDPTFKSGNFIGWIQHRKMLFNENVDYFEEPST